MFCRLIHDLERRHLSVEALGLACRYLETEEFPPEVAERALDESVRLGRSGRLRVGAELFSAVLEALWEEAALPPAGRESAFPVEQSARWTC